MWDYYQDQLLLAITAQHDNDFEKVASFFSRSKPEAGYTVSGCKERWEHLSSEKGKDSSSQHESPLEKTLKRLKEKRQNKDFLKVTPEDIKSAYTIDFTGNRVKVSGELTRL